MEVSISLSYGYIIHEPLYQNYSSVLPGEVAWMLICVCSILLKMFHMSLAIGYSTKIGTDGVFRYSLNS